MEEKKIWIKMKNQDNKGKMKFPRYTRKENLACKLLDKQIIEIQQRKKTGESYASIAKDFNVTPQAIYYWCLDEKERKATYAGRIRQSGTFNNRAYRERKKKLHPELMKYEISSTIRYRTEKPEQAKIVMQKASKNYWKKNKEKLTEKAKEYQLANLDKFRAYNKKHREFFGERVRKQQRESYLRLKKLKFGQQVLVKR